MIMIKRKWSASGLADIYPEVTEFIRKKAETEQLNLQKQFPNLPTAEKQISIIFTKMTFRSQQKLKRLQKKSTVQNA